MNAVFQPKNKAYYRGKHGRILMSHAGEACIDLGSVTYPAEQTKDCKPLTVTFIRFSQSALSFQVRPCDVVPS